jgi:hypothetical protein
MIATLVKGLVLVALATVVVAHAPSDLRPVKRAAVHATTVVTSQAHAIGTRVSRTWSRIKRMKRLERVERIWSLDTLSRPAPPV